MIKCRAARGYDKSWQLFKPYKEAQKFTAK